MTVQFPSIAQALAEEIGTLRKWLEEDALPLWWEVGSARPDGGFYERLGQDAKPVFLMTAALACSRVRPIVSLPPARTAGRVRGRTRCCMG